MLAHLTLTVGPARAQDIPEQGHSAPRLVAQTEIRQDERASHEYWRLMVLGLREFKASRSLEARALFLRAHRIWPNARSLRALGMSAFNLADYPQAVRELSASVVDTRRPLTPALRDHVRELLDRANTFVGVYRLQLSPEHAQLRIDGSLATLEPDGTLLMAVGKHLLRAEAEGHEPIEHPLVVDGTDGATLRLELRRLVSPQERKALPPLSRPLASRQETAWPTRVFHDQRWTWALGLSALLLGVTAGVLQVEAVRENARIEAGCSLAMCDPADDVTDRRDRLQGWSRGLLTGSGLLTAATTVLFLRDTARE